jgi:hypothetical protein
MNQPPLGNARNGGALRNDGEAVTHNRTRHGGHEAIRGVACARALYRTGQRGGEK